jgi:alpha-ribazole phosphatase
LEGAVFKGAGEVTKKLLLLRHARHAAAESRKFYGSTDIGLSEYGQLQATAIASFLQPYHPDQCFCSPLKRCRETVQPLSGFPIEILPDLREVNFGLWEEKTFEEIQSLNPVAVNQWAEFDPFFAFPGGERLDDYLSRIGRVASFLTSVSEKTLLVVTHAGVIRSLICHFLGLNPRDYILFNVDYGSLTILEIFKDKGVLIGLNYPCFQENI